jgi:Zn-dependent M28 family amino/carboxypeptidase
VTEVKNFQLPGVIFVAFFFASCSRPLAPPPETDSKLAWKILKELTAFGPRHSGTENNIRQAEFIASKAEEFGVKATRLAFTGKTPEGPKMFINIEAEIKGTKNEFLIIGSHFDTKKLEGFETFQGANDGASSTALLLAMIKAIRDSGKTPDHTLKFVFFDGEECLYSYSASDGLWGSREYAEKLRRENKQEYCSGVIILDMVADKKLNITLSRDTPTEMARGLFKAAEIKGLRDFFGWHTGVILDDHKPFQDMGIPAIDIIDFDFGPSNSYWHTGEDNISNVSEQSLKKVGEVAMYFIWNFRALVR